MLLGATVLLSDSLVFLFVLFLLLTRCILRSILIPIRCYPDFRVSSRVARAIPVSTSVGLAPISQILYLEFDSYLQAELS